MPREFANILHPGEMFVEGVGHAEETILNNAGRNWVLLEGGASRNVCFGCYSRLQRAMMELGGPTFRPGAFDRTVFRMFWAR
jgi:hypothetical protein